MSRFGSIPVNPQPTNRFGAVPVGAEQTAPAQAQAPLQALPQEEVERIIGDGGQLVGPPAAGYDASLEGAGAFFADVARSVRSGLASGIASIPEVGANLWNAGVDRVTGALDPLDMFPEQAQAARESMMITDPSIALPRVATVYDRGATPGSAVYDQTFRGVADAIQAQDAAAMSPGAQVQDSQFAETEGFGDTLGFLVRNPAFTARLLSGEIGEELPTLLAPGGTVGKVLAGGAQAGALNARDVRDAIESAPPEAVAQLAQLWEIPEGDTEAMRAELLRVAPTRVFERSTAVNTLLQGLVPGARKVEEVFAGAPIREGASRIGNVVRGAAGEAAAGSAGEVADTGIVNDALGRDVTEGMGKSAALGLVLDGGAGAAAGALQQTRSRREGEIDIEDDPNAEPITREQVLQDAREALMGFQEMRAEGPLSAKMRDTEKFIQQNLDRPEVLARALGRRLADPKAAPARDPVGPMSAEVQQAMGAQQPAPKSEEPKADQPKPAPIDDAQRAFVASRASNIAGKQRTDLVREWQTAETDEARAEAAANIAAYDMQQTILAADAQAESAAEPAQPAERQPLRFAPRVDLETPRGPVSEFPRQPGAELQPEASPDPAPTPESDGRQRLRFASRVDLDEPRGPMSTLLRAGDLGESRGPASPLLRVPDGVDLNSPAGPSTPRVRMSDQAATTPRGPVSLLNGNDTEALGLDSPRGPSSIIRRRPFAQPDQVSRDEQLQAFRELGLSPERAKKAAEDPRVARQLVDDVTGVFRGTAGNLLENTLKRAQEHSARSGEPVVFVSADLINLGGINKARNNVADAANRDFRAMVDVLTQALRETGGDVIPTRTGGDEFGFIVVNATEDQVRRAMAVAQERTQSYAQSAGLANIDDGKNRPGAPKGTGWHLGAATVAPGDNLKARMKAADLQINESKKRGGYDVGGEQTESAGPAAPEGQPRRAGPRVEAAARRDRGGEPEAARRVEGEAAAPSQSEPVARRGEGTELSGADPEGYIAELNRRVPFRNPDESPSAETRRAAAAIPTFQGGKAKMARAITEKVRKYWGRDADKIDTIIDYFGGSGSWGAYMASTTFKNVRRLVIHEFNPERLQKIRLFNERGNEIGGLLKNPAVSAYFEAIAKAIAEKGTFSGSAIANMAARRDLRKDLADRARSAIGSDAFEGLRQAVQDQGNASFGRMDSGTGSATAAVDKVLGLVRGHAEAAHGQMQALRDRGVTIEFVTGNSYEAAQTPGRNVLAMVDPPYYATKGYNGVSLVGIDTYNDTRLLLDRLRASGNSVIYTDEAWWEKRNKDTGAPVVPPDVDQQVDGLDAFGQLSAIQDLMGEFFRMPIATRTEVVGFINGHRNGRSVAAAEGNPTGSTDGRGVRPDDRGVGRGAGEQASGRMAPGDGEVPGAPPAQLRSGRDGRVVESGIPAGLPARLTAATREINRRFNQWLARNGRGSEQIMLRSVDKAALPDALARALRSIESATGTTVEVVRNTTPDVESFNGLTFRDGVIAVDERADQPVTLVAMHEWVHNLRSTDPDLYARLEAEVRRQGRLPAWAARMRREGNRTDDDGMTEELVADAVADAFTDPDFLRELGRRDVGLFRQAAQAILDFLDTLLGGAGDRGTAAYLQDVQAFRDVLADVVQEFESREREAGDADADPSFQRSAAPVFYSAALRAIEAGAGAPRRADAAAWKGWLDGAVRRGEMKQSERDWLDIDGWLDRQPGAVTREALAEFVRANEVQASETILTDEAMPGDSWTTSDGESFGSEIDAFRHERRIQGGPISDADFQRLVSFQPGPIGKADGLPKFDAYRLPGGRNYRELLLTLPEHLSRAAAEAEFESFRRAMAEKYGGDWVSELSTIEEAVWGKLDDARRDGRPYRSSHWDQPNVLAHIRMDERTDADGKRVLFVQEIQSDWHQEGRKKGYRSADGSDALLHVQLEELAYEADDDDTSLERRIEIGKEINAINARLNAVPNAPLKTTDEWAMLAFKRAARWAVENGFDRIAWATGEQNAELFDLSKTISRVEYTDSDMLLAEDAQGRYVIRERVPEGKLADYIGKEAAEKLLAQEPRWHSGLTSVTARSRVLTGQQLKVGGEGMRGFYDKILPAAVSKWGKKFGARAGSTEFVGIEGPDDVTRVHAIDITPAMREAVEGGQPMFQRPSNSTRRYLRQQAQQAVLTDLAARGYSQGSQTFNYDAGRHEGVRGKLVRARENLQDKLYSMREAQADIERSLGVVLDDAQNVYRLENLAHGRASDQMDKLERDVLEPMREIMRAADLTLDQLHDYLLARHAPERNAKVASINPDMPDGGSGISTADAQAVMAGTKAGPYSGKKLDGKARQELAKVARLLDVMRDRTLDNMVRAGVISEQQRTQLKSAYKYYVPLRGKGDPDDFGGTDGGGAGGRMDFAAPRVKRALGRGEGNLPGHIFAELLGDAERAIVSAELAAAREGVLRLAMQYPNRDVWEVEPVDMEWAFSEATGEAYLRVKNRLQAQADSLLVPLDGKTYRVRINDSRLREALLNLNKVDMNAVVRVLGAINRFQSATLTRYNPSFLAINLLRDLGFGLTGVASEHGARTAAEVAASYPQAAAALWRDVRGGARGDASVPDSRKGWSEWAREFAEAGGKTGITLYNDIQTLDSRYREGVRSLRGLWREGAKGKAQATIEGMIRVGKTVLDVIDHANDAIENAIRLSLYVSLRKQGRSAEQAAEAAKNLTVNFNRKGNYASGLGAVWLFYNAAVQGSHRVLKVLSDKRVLGGLTALGALQGVLALSLMADDDDEDGVSRWDAIPEYRRFNSFIVPAPWHEDGYFAIPMPYGFNAFTFMGGRLAQLGRDVGRNDEKAVVNFRNDLMVGVARSFSPVPVDDPKQIFGNVAGILLSLASNTDDLGRPISAETYGRPVPAATTGRAGTPEAFVQMAKALNWIGGGSEDELPTFLPILTDVSPDQLAFLWREATGGIGGNISAGMSAVEGIAGGRFESAAEAVAAAPLVRSFGIVGNRDRAVQDRYYRLRSDLGLVEDRAKRATVELVQANGGDLAAAAADWPAVRATLGPLAQGLEPERYRANGRRPDGTRYRAGDLKRSQAGGLVLKPVPGAPLKVYEDAERVVKEQSLAIREARAGDLSLAEREAAIKEAQRIRREAQQEVLRAVNRARNPQ